MIPKQPALDATMAEQLLQIILGILDGALRTGDTTQVLSPVTLLNASRLMLNPEYAQQPRTYAALGMLHFFRHQRPAGSSVELDAAVRFFSHVYPLDPRLVPDPLRQHFEEKAHAPEPIWEILHTHARVLFDEFLRDRGERLLDHAILLYKLSLSTAPQDYPYRPGMEHNLGTAWFQRFHALKEPDDLDAAIAALQRATQTVPAGHPDRIAMWFSLGTALWSRFDLVRNPDLLDEAIDLFRAVAEQVPPDHPVRPTFSSALSHALVARYQLNGDLADVRSALSSAEAAVAAAPPESPERPQLMLVLEAIREMHPHDVE